MGDGLARIIDLQISRETAAVSQAGFGTANFLSFDALFLERIKEYSNYDAVLEDDLVGDDSKAFAQSYFGQDNRPSKLYITRKGKDLPRIQTLDFAGDFVTGNDIDLDINGTPITTVPFDTDHATTLANLATEIQSDASVSTAAVTGSNQITITAQNNDVPLTVTDIVVSSGASQTTGSVTVTQYEDEDLTDVESLTEAATINDDWYAVAAYQQNPAGIKLIAAHVNAQRKIYGVRTEDSDVLTSATTDIASELKALNYDRVFVIFSEDSESYPEGAWLGGLLPKLPGSVTWKFKTLANIAVDSLTDTEKSNALGKNCNTHTTVGGTAITEEGVMASGEFIDNIRSTDWLHARIRENVFQAFVSEDKIPYTDGGVQTVVNRINQILLQGVSRTVLRADPAPTIDAPLVANVPVNTRANRTLPDVTFEAQLAGAIHKVIIRGTVSV